MYSVYQIVYSTQCIMYSVCRVYSVQSQHSVIRGLPHYRCSYSRVSVTPCTEHTVHCNEYTAHCTEYTTHCNEYTAHCNEYTAHCTLYSWMCQNVHTTRRTKPLSKTNSGAKFGFLKKLFSISLLKFGFSD